MKGLSLKLKKIMFNKKLNVIEGEFSSVADGTTLMYSRLSYLFDMIDMSHSQRVIHGDV